MTQNTTQTMIFKDFFGKKILVDFNAGQVSSDGGLLLLRQTETRLKLIDRVSAVLHDRRNPAYIKHGLKQLLSQRVYQIAAGSEDANDCTTLKEDPILKIACESNGPLASQPTMCRFENAPGRATLYRMAHVLVDVFIDSYQRPPASIIWDIDDTDDPTHGSQQLSLFNAYHDGYCYQPLHIYEGQSGKLITTILRPGRRPSGREVVSILKRLIPKLRKAWPKVGIILRGDAHFSSPAICDFCEVNNIKYVLGYSSYPPLVKPE